MLLKKENSSCLSPVSHRLTRRLVIYSTRFLVWFLESQSRPVICWCSLHTVVYSHYCLSLLFQVQIRPWKLSDSDFIMDHTQPIDPRKTIFIGGVPRPLKAAELADIFNSRYGNVCYAGIDCDPELKYPKGQGQHDCNNKQDRC